MKPLYSKDLASFNSRFGNFLDAEIRSVDIISPTTMKLVLAAQDSARGFDWITVELEFNGVSDAKLIEESKLTLLDISDGLTLIYEKKCFAFAVGSCQSLSNIKDAIIFIVSSSVKYKEGSF
ncbi:MAG: hypothetical protein U9N33_08590 [Campylobacterota bacterium]|nr:hypothetical protein [Campylobacterota bacterium]